MKKLIVAVCALFIVGCEDIGGTLQAFKSFTANTQDGTETVAAGSYKTSLNFKKREIIATLKTDSKETKFSIKMPKGTSVPANGNFEIRSAQSGQPFDIMGSNATVEKRGENQTSYDSCQVTYYENICTPQGCYTRPVTRWGQKITNYYMNQVSKDLQIDMMDLATSNSKVAHFSGAASYTEKVIVHESNCF